MKLTYPAIFYYHKGEDVYTVEVPDLPGCSSYGHTLAEAIAMGADAACCWVLTALENGQPLPKASPIENTPPNPNEGDSRFASMLMLDMDTYAQKYGEEAPQTNLTVNMTIPEWLNAFAEEQHIDYSKTLRKSLTEMYVRENQAAYG